MANSKRLRGRVNALMEDVRLLVNWKGPLPADNQFIAGRLPCLRFDWVTMSRAQRAKARRELRRVWEGGRVAERALTGLMRLNEKAIYKYPTRPRYWVNLKARRVEYQPETSLEEACYWLMKRAQLIRRCALKGCPAPLFVANRPRSRFCTTECSHEAEKERKRVWIRNERKKGR